MNNKQTVFFLLVDPMDKNQNDPDTIDLNIPRHARYMHKAWKGHQNAVYGFDINLALKKGIEVLSNLIERDHFSRGASSFLHSESGWKLEKSYARKYINHLGFLQRSP